MCSVCDMKQAGFSAEEAQKLFNEGNLYASYNPEVEQELKKQGETVSIQAFQLAGRAERSIGYKMAKLNLAIAKEDVK